MSPRDFHALSESLSRVAGAAECRSAVSRAYYAAHHVGKTALQRLGVDEQVPLRVPNNASAHQVVIDLLWHSGDPELRRLSATLDNLRSQRLKADYHLDDRHSVDSASATVVVQSAAMVMDEVERILLTAGPRRRAAAMAMARNHGG